MVTSNNKTTKYIDASDASVVDLKLPQQGTVKLLILPGSCNGEDIGNVAQTIADSCNEPVAAIQADRAGTLPRYKMVYATQPTAQAQLVHASYNITSSGDTLPEVLQQVWGLLSIGVAIVQFPLRIAFINDAAKNIMRQKEMLGKDIGGLYMLSNNHMVQKIANSIRKRSTSNFDINHNGLSWQAIVTPISTDYSALFMFCCLLSERDCALIRERYRLSIGEIKLIEQFIKTPEVTDIAANLHISVTTARTVMRNIYDKVGVNSQQKLMQLLLANSAMSLSSKVKPNRKRRSRDVSKNYPDIS